MRTILDGALHHLYQAELTKIDWNIFMEDYNTTLSKLEGMEVDILEKREVRLQLDRISGNKGLPAGLPPLFKPNNKRKQPPIGGHPKVAKIRCKTCGKFHKGECYYSKDYNKKRKPVKQEDFKSQLLTVLKEISSEKTDGYATDTSWKKGTTSDERVFVASTLAAETSDSDASIESDRAWKLLKTFRKTKKKLNKRA